MPTYILSNIFPWSICLLFHQYHTFFSLQLSKSQNQLRWVLQLTFFFFCIIGLSIVVHLPFHIILEEVCLKKQPWTKTKMVRSSMEGWDGWGRGEWWGENGTTALEQQWKNKNNLKKQSFLTTLPLLSPVISLLHLFWLLSVCSLFQGLVIFCWLVCFID